MTADRSSQPQRIRPALEGLETLGFGFAVIREVLKEQAGWRDMRGFVAKSDYCRSHEAEGLNVVARRVFACVEEAAVNEAAAELAQIERSWKRDRTALLPFVR